jgi:O-antigen ligase
MAEVIPSSVQGGRRLAWATAATVLVVGGTVLIFDPSAYYALYVPKQYFVIISGAAAFSVLTWTGIRGGMIRISIIEALITLRILWMLLSGSSAASLLQDPSFLVLVGLLFWTFSIRGLTYAGEDGASRLYIARYLITFFWLLVVLGSLQALLGLYQYASATGYVAVHAKTPLTGTVGPANDYGAVVAICLCSACILFLQSRTLKVRLALGCAASLLAVSLVLNGSRGAGVGLLCGLLFLGICRARGNAAQDLLPGAWRRAVGGFGPIGKGAVVVASLVALIVSVLVLYSIDPVSSSGRLMIWKIATPMLTAHPLAGVGHGEFAMAYMDLQAAFFESVAGAHIGHRAAGIKSAHNELLHAFFESGIIGGGLFLLIWMFAVQGVFRGMKLQPSRLGRAYEGLGGLLILVLVHAMVDDPISVLPVAIIVYTILGVLPVPGVSFRLSGRFKRFLGGGLSFAIFAAAVVMALIQYPGYRAWNDGQRAAGRLDWERAIGHYESALERLPGRSELQFHLGSALTFSGRAARGSYFLEQARGGFRDRNLELALSIAYLRLGELELAEAHALNALRMYPAHLAPHLILGEIYFEQGRFAESQAALRRCIERQSRVQTSDVYRVAVDATILWDRLYGGNSRE